MFCPQTRPLPHDPRGCGQNVKIQLFLEHGHVAYQIKGNHKCRNMVANILPTDPLTPPPHNLGMRSIGQHSTFQNMAMWPIKLNGITKCSKMVANILPADPPLTLGSKGQNSFFQNMVMLHINLLESRMQQHCTQGVIYFYIGFYWENMENILVC